MQGGSIRIDQKMVWAALLAVPLLLFVGVMAARQGSVMIGGVLIVGTVICGIGTLPALSARLDVSWDAAGLAGPAQVLGPFILFRRATIGWDEIVEIGGTGFNYAYVAAADGRRIYWTELHAPPGRLFDVLKRRRPDILSPPLTE